MLDKTSVNLLVLNISSPIDRNRSCMDFWTCNGTLIQIYKIINQPVPHFYRLVGVLVPKWVLRMLFWPSCHLYKHTHTHTSESKPIRGAAYLADKHLITTDSVIRFGWITRRPVVDFCGVGDEGLLHIQSRVRESGRNAQLKQSGSVLQQRGGAKRATDEVIDGFTMVNCASSVSMCSGYRRLTQTYLPTRNVYRYSKIPIGCLMD